MKYGWTLGRPEPTIIKTPEEVRALKELLANFNGPTAVDFETTGLNIAKDVVVYGSI